jgi:hypothetical protein
VLADGEPEEQGIAEARQLMERLGVLPDQMLQGAYLDLLADVAAPASSRGIASARKS